MTLKKPLKVKIKIKKVTKQTSTQFKQPPQQQRNTSAHQGLRTKSQWFYSKNQLQSNAKFKNRAKKNRTASSNTNNPKRDKDSLIKTTVQCRQPPPRTKSSDENSSILLSTENAPGQSQQKPSSTREVSKQSLSQSKIKLLEKQQQQKQQQQQPKSSSKKSKKKKDQIEIAKASPSPESISKPTKSLIRPSPQQQQQQQQQFRPHREAEFSRSEDIVSQEPKPKEDGRAKEKSNECEPNDPIENDVSKTATAPLDESVRKYLQKENFNLINFVAQSTFCVVYLVRDSAGNDRAAKVIDHRKLSPLIRDEHLPKELAICEQIRHLNIIRTDTVLSALRNFSIIISEFAPDGDLVSYLERKIAQDDLPPARLLKKWFVETANALAYLHRRYITHRDIKLDNILLCKGLVAKLADFGFATYCRDSAGRPILCEVFCGTIEYQAPETLMCDEPYDGMIADCFSLGVVLYVLMTRQFPFGRPDERCTADEMKSLLQLICAKRWPKIGAIESDSDLRSLLTQLLNPDTGERIQASQVLEHRWIRSWWCEE